MIKLESFTPPKPLTEPFGPGTGNAHTFHLGRDGVTEIVEMETGAIRITQQQPNGERKQFIQPSGGGYARVLSEKAPPEKATPR
jgi:hypothetical protein